MHRTFLATTLAAALVSTTPALEPLWRFLGSLWADNGCIADPDGRCLPGPGTSSLTGDNGCVADPNGRCIG